MWPFRRRTHDRLPVPVTNGSREKEAVELLHRSERKAALMDVLSRRADLLVEELQRALGGPR